MNLIRLDQLLKMHGVVETGGEAKQLIRAGQVRVNGEVETRRSRKLQEGDVVEVGDLRLTIAEDAEGDGEEMAAAGE